MKIIREKRIRSEYVKSYIDRIAQEITRPFMGEKTEETRKTYRNICKTTGRSRGYIKKMGMSRLEYRRRAEEGKIEGIRHASW